MKSPGCLRSIWRSLAGGRSILRRGARATDQRRGGEAGQAIIEVAIALPVIVTFMFAMIELCLVFYSDCMISESAREGTRYAIVRGATCQTSTGASCTASASAINSAVSSLGWPNLGNGTLTANTTYPDGNENPGSRVQVVVSYVFPYNIPFMPKGSIHMSSTSVMYIIQ